MRLARKVASQAHRALLKAKFSGMSFDAARDAFVKWVENARDTETPIHRAQLKEMGFTYIAHGAHASTFLSACGRFVLKLNYDFDDAYRRFVDLALTRQDNPYYPRIYFACQKPAFQAVLMENLKPLHEGMPQWAEADYLQQQVCFGMMPRNPEGSADFVKLVWDMWSLISQDGVREDIAGRNLMVREENGCLQLVVVDPVCTGDSSSSW